MMQMILSFQDLLVKKGLVFNYLHAGASYIILRGYPWRTSHGVLSSASQASSVVVESIIHSHMLHHVLLHITYCLIGYIPKVPGWFHNGQVPTDRIRPSPVASRFAQLWDTSQGSYFDSMVCTKGFPAGLAVVHGPSTSCASWIRALRSG